MSVSRLAAAHRRPGLNAPDNFTKAVDHRFFADSVVFTLKYTVLATVLLLGPRAGAGPAGAGVEPVERPAAGVVPDPQRARAGVGVPAVLRALLAVREPAGAADGRARTSRFLGSPTAALFSTTFLIVWRYAGFYMLLMLVGLQGIPADVYEAARIDGADRLADLPEDHPAAAAPDPGADARSSASPARCWPSSSSTSSPRAARTTAPSPSSSSSTSVAFQGQNDLGVAAAISVIVLVALVVINALQLRAFRSEES